MNKEAVRNYFAENAREMAEADSLSCEYYIGVKQAIVKTLNLLGVVIDGVNAEIPEYNDNNIYNNRTDEAS